MDQTDQCGCCPATADVGPLTAVELVQIRRQMGYPAFGGISSGQQSWRFFEAYGFNEWRIRNMAPDEYAQIRCHLAECVKLERAIYGASGNLDTDQAAVWTRNRSEVADRMGLYRWARMQLCLFLGIPPGPALCGGSRIVI